MQQETVSLTGRRELRLRRMFERIVRVTVRYPQQYDEVRRRGREIAVLLNTPDAVKGLAQPKPTHDRAEARRLWYVERYSSLGFRDVTIPKPDISNREFARREASKWNGRSKIPQRLFVVPPILLVSYQAWMTANGQDDHWTLTDEANRALIRWDQGNADWVWHWVDTPRECPRLDRAWNTLNAEIKLLTLRDYVHLWHDHHACTGIMLDTNTWCWLATRFGQSALDASGDAGGVCVGRDRDPAYLASGFVSGGGRAAGVVQAAA